MRGRGQSGRAHARYRTCSRSRCRRDRRFERGPRGARTPAGAKRRHAPPIRGCRLAWPRNARTARRAGHRATPGGMSAVPWARSGVEPEAPTFVGRRPDFRPGRRQHGDRALPARSSAVPHVSVRYRGERGDRPASSRSSRCSRTTRAVCSFGSADASGGMYRAIRRRTSSSCAFGARGHQRGAEPPLPLGRVAVVRLEERVEDDERVRRPGHVPMRGTEGRISSFRVSGPSGTARRISRPSGFGIRCPWASGPRPGGNGSGVPAFSRAWKSTARAAASGTTGSPLAGARRPATERAVRRPRRPARPREPFAPARRAALSSRSAPTRFARSSPGLRRSCALVRPRPESRPARPGASCRTCPIPHRKLPRCSTGRVAHRGRDASASGLPLGGARGFRLDRGRSVRIPLLASDRVQGAGAGRVLRAGRAAVRSRPARAGTSPRGTPAASSSAAPIGGVRIDASGRGGSV